MKIYLDDIRNPTTNGWTVVRTAHECIELLKNHRDEVTEISFDHDLGDTDYTGHTVALWIEERCYLGVMKCPKWNIHSANPVGAANIKATMESAERMQN